MSQEDVEVVREIYAQWARGNMSAGETFDTEIAFESFTPDANDGRGRGSGVEIDARFYDVSRFARARSSAWTSSPSVPKPSKPRP